MVQKHLFGEDFQPACIQIDRVATGPLSNGQESGVLHVFLPGGPKNVTFAGWVN